MNEQNFGAPMQAVEDTLRRRFFPRLTPGSLRVTNVSTPVKYVTPDGAKAMEWQHTGEIIITMRGSFDG